MKRADIQTFLYREVGACRFTIAPCRDDSILDFDKFIVVRCVECGWLAYHADGGPDRLVTLDITEHEKVCAARAVVA